MRNYFVNRRREKTANITVFDYNLAMLKYETIKEMAEEIYLLVLTEYRIKNGVIRAGLEASCLFETSCSGFYTNNGPMYKIRCGSFEILRDARLPGNIIIVESLVGPWAKIVLENFVI